MYDDNNICLDFSDVTLVYDENKKSKILVMCMIGDDKTTWLEFSDVTLVYDDKMKGS